MQEQYKEIYAVIVIGAAMVLLLVVFIVTILFLYQRRQHRQEKELVLMKDKYEQEALRSQLEIQESTFKSIGQELHDNIGQLLSVVKLSLSGLPITKEEPAYEPLQNARQILNKAVMDLSDLTKNLHSDRISLVGLAESIRLELATIKRTGLIKVQFSLKGEEYEFDQQHSIFIFRIFQENINNILKHSGASLLIVNIQYRPDVFKMEIIEDGKGFNVEEKRKSSEGSRGVGLSSMYNRAKLIGAKFTIKSEAGKGSTGTIELPLMPQQVQ
jgi:two-component system, NarL family, sensor kinase